MTMRLFSARMRAASRSSCFTNARATENETDLPDLIRSWMMSMVPYTARPTRQVSPTTAPRRFLMAETTERSAIHPGAVVGVEGANALGNVIDLSVGDFLVEQRNFAVHKRADGIPSQVNDDLQQFVAVVRLLDRMADVRRQYVQQGFEVVCDSMLSYDVKFPETPRVKWREKSKGKDISARANTKDAACLRVKEGEIRNIDDGVPAFQRCHAQSFACQASRAVM